MTQFNPRRHIRQIAVADGDTATVMAALCDDDTVWLWTAREGWARLPYLPGTEPRE